MNDDQELKIQKAIAIAKEHGCPWVEVDGIRIPIGENPQVIEVKLQTDEELAKAFASDPFADLTDEEIAYYATPYFDELQEKKKLKQEALEKEQQVRNG